MSDIATVSTAGPIGFAFDLALGGGDLQTDHGLATAVIQSLFTDRLAAADDVIPDGGGNRRGCWMDEPLADGEKDLSGSRLWLLEREKATPRTAARAQRYALEALEWLKRDGIAAGITVTAAYDSRDFLQLFIDIVRQVGGRQVNQRFDFIWNPALPAPLPPPQPAPVLATETGEWLVTEDGTPLLAF